jgi:hypothetical protein
MTTKETILSTLTPDQTASILADITDALEITKPTDERFSVRRFEIWLIETVKANKKRAALYTEVEDLFRKIQNGR